MRYTKLLAIEYQWRDFDSEWMSVKLIIFLIPFVLTPIGCLIIFIIDPTIYVIIASIFVFLFMCAFSFGILYWASITSKDEKGFIEKQIDNSYYTKIHNYLEKEHQHNKKLDRIESSKHANLNYRGYYGHNKRINN